MRRDGGLCSTFTATASYTPWSKMHCFIHFDFTDILNKTHQSAQILRFFSFFFMSSGKGGWLEGDNVDGGCFFFFVCMGGGGGVGDKPRIPVAGHIIMFSLLTQFFGEGGGFVFAMASSNPNPLH